MTDIKRLSLHGRLRMASVVRGPDTDLMIEAADAIEQHEAFKREVSEAVEKLLSWPSIRSQGIIVENLSRFIAKPDPHRLLVEVIQEVRRVPVLRTDAEMAEELRAAIEKRGGKIVWGDD